MYNIASQSIPSEGQAILPNVLYQAVLADYLSFTDLIKLITVFEDMGCFNIFPDTFWKTRLEARYGRLLRTLPERKDEVSQKMGHLYEEKKYREVYEVLQTEEISPSESQFERICSLLKDEQKETIQAHQDELRNCLSEITSLSLLGSRLGNSGAERLGVALEKNTTLSSLDLRYNKIGASGTESLGVALEKNTTLSSLDLRYNKIGASGTESLGAALEKNTTLTSLDLYSNQIGDSGAENLAKALGKNATLKILDLGGNQIGDSGTEKLAKALEKNTMLIKLYLRGNQIGDSGTERLGAALKKNTTLTSLDLMINQIRDSGAESLGGSLEKNIMLTSLYLGYNQIRDSGAESLGAALKKNATLTSLYLGHNQIGDFGAESLGAALEKNTTLINLDLGYNQIGDFGTKRLAKALEKNTTLISLSLDYNQIGEEQRTVVNDFIKRNCQLRDECIEALKQGYLQRVQHFFQQGVSLNGILLKLVRPDPPQLESLQYLMQWVQSYREQSIRLPIFRGVLFEAIEQAEAKQHKTLITLLHQFLNILHDLPDVSEVKESPKIIDEKKFRFYPS